MLLKGLAKLECSLMDTGASRFSFSFLSNLKDYKKTYHITLSAQKKWLHDKSIFIKNYSTCSKKYFLLYTTEACCILSTREKVLNI